jgi:hypothetical protein
VVNAVKDLIELVSQILTRWDMEPTGAIFPAAACRKDLRIVLSRAAKEEAAMKTGAIRSFLLNVIEDLDMRQDCCGIDYLDTILLAQKHGPCPNCKGSGIDSFEGDAMTCSACDGRCYDVPG